MARRHDARDYLLQGLTPQQIARKMGISLNSVRQYLCTVLGEGSLLRTDSTLSIADQDRNYIEEAIRSKEYTSEFGTTSIQWMVYRRRKKQIPQEVISLYMLTRDPRPDLYALICGLEIMLHKLLKCVLQSAYGDDWWRKGIPSDVRKGCQNRREDDEDPVPDPYQYTNFIDIKAIIDKQWAIFSAALPNDLAANRPEMLSKLQRVNGIRNRVMHPVKEIGGYEEDYKFLRAFLADCDEANWRLET